MELLQHSHAIEFLGKLQAAHKQHRRHARGNRRNQEQNRQQSVVPQRERLAHAEQSARVCANAYREHRARDLKPRRHLLFQAVEQKRDKRDNHECRQEHNAPGHNRARIVQKQRETQRVVQTGLSVEHQQEQADDNDHRSNDVAGEAHAARFRMLPAQKRRSDEGAAAQACKEEVPRNRCAPNWFK